MEHIKEDPKVLKSFNTTQTQTSISTSTVPTIHKGNIFNDVESPSSTSLLVDDQQAVEGASRDLDSIMDSPSIDLDLDDPATFPETMSELITPGGSRVYLIGTAHFSLKSNEEVRRVIQAVKPDIVVVELCPQRSFLLTLSEEALLQENKDFSFARVKKTIQERGFAQGLILLVLFKFSSSITNQLDMAPGSEFRVAASEAGKITGCRLVLGDRCIRTTLARLIASLSFYQMLKLIYSVSTDNGTLTLQDVEKFKGRDYIELLISELGGHYPGMKRVLLDERDIYLSHTIYRAANYSPSGLPLKVVAVVGIGHVPGVKQHWGNTTDEQVRELDQKPVSSKKKIFVTKTIKYCSFAVLVYFGYRMIVPSRIQEAISEKLVVRLSSR